MELCSCFLKVPVHRDPGHRVGGSGHEDPRVEESGWLRGHVWVDLGSKRLCVGRGGGGGLGALSWTSI